ncbi:hypothetical protein ACH518_09440 [Methylomonas sp. HW2-6]|uniref:hypothetical protein n=1 Tax=Methylomonas sp. HW2-6 TaxID=3376687 RepID=UPI004041F2F2
MAQIIPQTHNTEWGFWGTLDGHTDPAAAWPIAVEKIANATHQPFETIQPFLDSRYGRQFGDTVLNHLLLKPDLTDAIAAAVDQWMNWKISKMTSKEYGIPKGVPYLTGFVIHCEVIEYAD